MADLVHKSLTSGPDPQLAEHYATKNYVDQNRSNAEINVRTGNYTLALSDLGKVIDMSSTSATQVTVPLNSSVPFPIGTIIRIRKFNTGNVTVAGASGVTIAWASSFTITTRYTMAQIHKGNTDQWVGMLIGT